VLRFGDGIGHQRRGLAGIELIAIVRIAIEIKAAQHHQVDSAGRDVAGQAIEELEAANRAEPRRMKGQLVIGDIENRQKTLATDDLAAGCVERGGAGKRILVELEHGRFGALAGAARQQQDRRNCRRGKTKHGEFS
jgi:hypothetical protein